MSKIRVNDFLVQHKLHEKQADVFEDPHRFKVVVAGRRWGKCLASGTLIQMADGSERPIESIRPGDTVLTVNEETYQIEPKRVVAVADNGVRETLRVSTSSHSVVCTPNHPILANNSWVDAGKLKAGDLVAIPKKTVFGVLQFDQLDLDILSIWLAEGANYTITNKTPEIIEIIKKYGVSRNLTVADKDGLTWTLKNGDRTGGSQAGSKNPMRIYLESVGLWGKNSKTKFIPDFVFQLEKSQLARFLNLFFACDGNISKRSKSTWSLECGLANEKMVRQIASLLLKFGIQGQIRYKKHKAKSVRSGEYFESWTFVASESKSIEIFATEIGCLGKEDKVQGALADARQSNGTCNRYLPVPHDEMVRHLSYNPVEKGKYGGYNCKVSRDMPEYLRSQLTSWRKQTPSRISIRRYENVRDFTDGFFDPLADGDIVWGEIRSVEAHGRVKTWDLQIEDNHNFISNGIVTHNSALAKVTLILRAAEKPKQNVWYVAPNYRMTKSIMWDELLDAIPPQWIAHIHHSDLRIRLVNGSRITCLSADNPDSLRGNEVNYLVLDEYQSMKADIWNKVCRPTLARSRGHALFIGTPMGYNLLYDVYQMGQSKDKYPQWMSWQFPTITSPFIPVSELEEARRDMDAKSFEQEFLASFTTMSGRVYYAFDRKTHVGKFPFNPELPIWIGQDFNVDPMCSVIMQPQKNGEIWIVDEIYLVNSNTAEVCEEIERRYWRYSKQITVYPDPAGGNRSSARGESDLDVFREKGFNRIRFRKKHPFVSDRVNSVNAQFKAADGSIRMRVDESCVQLIQSLEQTLYKEGTREVNKAMGVEHISDALGYPTELERPTRKIFVGGVSL